MPTDPFLSPVRFLEVAHVCHRLSVSPGFVRRLIHEGQLAAIRISNRFRVDPLSLEAYIEAQRVSRESASAQHRGREGPRESTVRRVPQAVNR